MCTQSSEIKEGEGRLGGKIERKGEKNVREGVEWQEKKIWNGERQRGRFGQNEGEERLTLWGWERGRPGEGWLVNKRMDDVDRRMLNGASGHLLSLHRLCRGMLGKKKRVSARLYPYHQETDYY